MIKGFTNTCLFFYQKWYMVHVEQVFKVLPITILADISTKDNLRFLARNFFDIEILKNFTSIFCHTY